MLERWKRSMLAGIVLCAGLLTGCGGEYAGLTEGDIVSGSAVSGSAVSGEAIRERAVSGPAIKNGENKSRYEEKQDMSSHRFCTDTNLYYVNEDGGQIMQARVDGTHRKCIRKCKDDKNEWWKWVNLLYVDGDWLYYNIELENEAITYRAPVKKDEKGYDVVCFSEKEQLVKTGSLIPIYADRDYYFYIDSETIKFIKYDLKRKKKVSEEEAGRIGKTMFRGKDYYFCVTDFELYVQKIDSTQWQKVSDMVVDDDLPSVSSAGELLYPRYVTKRDDLGFDSRFDIRRHDGEQERTFVTWNQLIQAVEEVTGTQKMDVCMPDQLFWQEGRIYIQLQTGWADGDIYHMEYMMFSQGENDSGLQYEKDLTECMKSHVKEREGKWTDEDVVYVEHMTVNDAQCIAMADGKAYLSLYDYENEKGRLGCYELKNEKFEWVSKTDNAFYRLGFDQSLNSTFQVDHGFWEVFAGSTMYADEWYWSPSKDVRYMGDFVEG